MFGSVTIATRSAIEGARPAIGHFDLPCSILSQNFGRGIECLTFVLIAFSVKTLHLQEGRHSIDDHVIVTGTERQAPFGAAGAEAMKKSC
ncbi:hypothetical protein ACFS07_33115 [Undibacterium arcticum]